MRARLLGAADTLRWRGIDEKAGFEATGSVARNPARARRLLGHARRFRARSTLSVTRRLVAAANDGIVKNSRLDSRLAKVAAAAASAHTGTCDRRAQRAGHREQPSPSRRRVEWRRRAGGNQRGGRHRRGGGRRPHRGARPAGGARRAVALARRWPRSRTAARDRARDREPGHCRNVSERLACSRRHRRRRQGRGHRPRLRRLHRHGRRPGSCPQAWSRRTTAAAAWAHPSRTAPPSPRSSTRWLPARSST